MADEAERDLCSQAGPTEPEAVQPPRRRRGHPPKDIIGQRFRMLTALYPTEKRDRNSTVVWHCRCDCGREVDVSYEDLVYSRMISCGCRKREAEQKLSSYLTHVAGTSVDLLKSEKLRVNNKTGVRGVYMVRGQYRAEIRLQGRGYRLGTFKTLHEAAAVRRRAENCLHKDFLAYYERWNALATASPAWGEANPITVEVIPRGQGEFQLILEPRLERHLSYRRPDKERTWRTKNFVK
ncbi:MAG: hypothetical protein LUC87_04210 [Clostridiales bacterium]|nr:hypothetical protein [Clostridiales bacterium]